MLIKSYVSFDTGFLLYFQRGCWVIPPRLGFMVVIGQLFFLGIVVCISRYWWYSGVSMSVCL